MQMVQRADDEGSTSRYTCTRFRCDEMIDSMKRPSVCAESDNDDTPPREQKIESKPVLQQSRPVFAFVDKTFPLLSPGQHVSSELLVGYDLLQP